MGHHRNAQQHRGYRAVYPCGRQVREEVTVSLRMLKSHKEKLEDIARHDTQAHGRRVTRSHLMRAAIARLIAGRKATLYNDPIGDTNDPEPE